jgi:RNA polymerase sigma-70 factor (ECF subfamily)
LRVLINAVDKKSSDLALHARLVAGDPVAAAECVERWLPQLERQLWSRSQDIAAHDSHLITTAAIDALLDYMAHPHKFDPTRSDIMTYLFMLARGDLLNAWSRVARIQGRTESLHAVELSLSGRNNLEEEVTTSIDAAAAWERVMEELPAPLDRKLLALMIQGVRDTTTYAQVLGIEHLPDQEQRATVKRHKDRISKRLQRLGESNHG